MTVEQALARSVSHNEIVHCSATRAELDDLLEISDDHIDLTTQYGYWDVWGTTDEGDYRLHVEVSP